MKPKATSIAGRFTSLVPRTLLVRTFLLICLLVFLSLFSWLTLFGLAGQEPRARQLGQLTVSAVNLTYAALMAADPVKRTTLLRDLAESEGVQLFPAEAGDLVKPLPDTYFFRKMRETVRARLGADTRFAAELNGHSGIWVSFAIDHSDEGKYWLMLPEERAAGDFPWSWLGWGILSLALALFGAWLIVSRVASPLKRLADVASEVGHGKHPAPLPESGAIELRRLAQAFNRMSDDLKRMAAERTEVLAGLSHDLRTPLARLRLEAEMSISDEPARAAVIEDIEQMDGIIAQFLDFARGERIETREATSLAALLGQLATPSSRQEEAPRLETTALPAVRVYPKALKRAIANLIDNAQKYGRPPIELAARIDGDELLIEILDRGPGIPESEVERLKRPFTRLENARSNASGTGLGLAIVERIARLHDGRLELLARQGGGLTARLRLPRVE